VPGNGSGLVQENVSRSPVVSVPRRQPAATSSPQSTRSRRASWRQWWRYDASVLGAVDSVRPHGHGPAVTVFVALPLATLAACEETHRGDRGRLPAALSWALVPEIADSTWWVPPVSSPASAPGSKRPPGPLPYRPVPVSLRLATTTPCALGGWSGRPAPGWRSLATTGSTVAV